MPRPDQNGPRLLLVDDVPARAARWSGALRGLGYAVVTATDAPGALARLTAESFNLLLAPVAMPGMNGIALLECVRADERLAALPVVILASAAELDAVAHCLERGADDYFLDSGSPSLLGARLAVCLDRHRLNGEVARHAERLASERRRVDDLVKAVIPIGVSLMGEKDFDRLLEAILFEAKSLCNADGGTLYLRTPDDHLRFVILRNDSLGISLGGSGGPIDFPPLPMRDPESGTPNLHNVATCTAVTGQSINIPDAYEAVGFEFSGTRAFDARTGYRSMSFLTVPLKRNSGEVIGVLQLLNALERDTGAVVPFEPAMQPIIESLSLLAAAALDAYLREQLLRAEIRELHIQIDEGKKARQVEEIAETDYFQMLQSKAKALRARA